MDKKEKMIRYGEIISKCWEDEAFKKRFIAEPEAVLEEGGIEIEEGITYKVIEAPKGIEYVILPREDVKESLQNLAKGLLNAGDKGDEILPDGLELRILQNTEEISYLVLPASPKTLTAAELKRITGGGSTVHATEVAVQTTEAVEVETSAVSIGEAGVAVVVGAAIVLI